MLDPSLRAAAFREAVALGLVAPATAAAWADMLIAAYDDPDVLLFDISTAGASVSAMVTALGNFAGSRNRKEVAPLVLNDARAAAAAGRCTYRQVSGILYHLVFNGFAPDDEAELQMRSLEDLYHVMESEHADEVVRSFLARFAHAGG